jgi:hypothetical protein
LEGRTERVLETRKMTNALQVVKGPETGLPWKKRWTKENDTMREGRLGYNYENGRYGLLSMDLWIDTGFHCGECMEVLVDDQWVQTRMEMNLAREWYLVGTPYCGELEYIRARIPD